MAGRVTKGGREIGRHQMKRERRRENAREVAKRYARLVDLYGEKVAPRG